MKKLLLVAIVILIGIGTWWLLQSGSETNNQNGIANRNSNVNFQTYINSKYGYSVSYPINTIISELTSGIENADDKGYIVDFTIGALPIRITATQNSRNDKSLEELIEVRDNIGMPLFVSDKDAYEKIVILGQPAFVYINTIDQNGAYRRTGKTVLLLGYDYYYQIQTGNQYTPEFTNDKENTFNSFVDTFKIIP